MRKACKGVMILFLPLMFPGTGMCASLMGDNIYGSVGYANFPSTPVVVVDSGEEFRTLFYAFENRNRVEAFADFGSNTVTLGFQEVTGDLGASFGGRPNIVFYFWDLDLDGGTTPITGLNLLARHGNDHVSFDNTADSITVTWELLALPAGSTESITLEIVPEPGTMVLLGLGAMMLKRRR